MLTERTKEKAMPGRTATVLAAAALLALAACGTPTAPGSPSQAEQRSEDAARDHPLQESKRERQTPAPAKEQDPAAGAAAARHADAVSYASQALVPAGPADLSGIRSPSEALDRETYAHFDDNPLKRVAEHPVSTFSIDVDTGAYSNVRRMLNAGRLPVQDAVRVEELINYFAYDYPAPAGGTPFNVVTELGPNPWNAKTHLLHIGLQGYDVPRSSIPAANLVFLVDVSGSMQSPDKLPLLKSALTLLAQQLRPADRISLVVYAGGTGVVLEPVGGGQQDAIIAALDSLSAGGRTNGAAGIALAYRMAEAAFVPGGINRVLLATDGDFNVGTTSFEALKDLIEQKRKTGISLTTLGFGTGNYNDHLMEQLAAAGNGNYAYIDTLNEARKVLVEQMSATLQTIAKDVKIQVEFNPDVVSEYRLIGYENRALAREDFNNDQVDAGEIGAGHTVTALYEVTLTGEGGERVDALRYQAGAGKSRGRGGEIAFLRLRYKAPDGEVSKLIERPIALADLQRDLRSTSERYRFAAAVAGFGQLLRGGKYMERFDYPDVLRLARSARGADPFGYRQEFITLVDLAQSLSSGDVQHVSQQ
jgi:Ca-activated chloride channel family protein